MKRLLSLAVVIYGQSAFSGQPWMIHSLVKDFQAPCLDVATGLIFTNSFRMAVDIPEIAQEMNSIRIWGTNHWDVMIGNEFFPLDDTQAISAVAAAIETSPENWHDESLKIAAQCQALRMDFGKSQESFARLTSEHPDNDDYEATSIYANLLARRNISETARKLMARWYRLGKPEALRMALELFLLEGMEAESVLAASEVIEHVEGEAQEMIRDVLFCALLSKDDSVCAYLVGGLQEKFRSQFVSLCKDSPLGKAIVYRLSHNPSTTNMNGSFYSGLEPIQSAAKLSAETNAFGVVRDADVNIAKVMNSATLLETAMSLPIFKLQMFSPTNKTESGSIISVQFMGDLDPREEQYKKLRDFYAAYVYSPVPFSDQIFCRAVVDGYEQKPELWKESSLKMIALSYLSLGNVKKAISVCERLQDGSSWNVSTILLLAHLYSLQDDPEKWVSASQLYQSAYQMTHSSFVLRPWMISTMRIADNETAGVLAKMIVDEMKSENMSYLIKDDAYRLYAFCLQTPDYSLGKQIFDDVEALLDNDLRNLGPAFVVACRKRFARDSSEAEHRPINIHVEFIRGGQFDEANAKTDNDD